MPKAAPKTVSRTVRHEKVHEMYNRINPQVAQKKATREIVAAAIDGLYGLSRSPRWDAAVKNYADLIRDEENPVDWAYFQGSVWFSYAVAGLC